MPLRRIAFIQLVVLAFLVTGCATNTALEPGVIVLRNSARHDLRSMAASEVAKDSMTAVRFGSVSPLLSGRDMAFDRQPDPPPLPRDAEVRWIDYEGEHRAVIPIRQAVRVATGLPGEALVLDLQPDGTITVYLEQVLR